MSGYNYGPSAEAGYDGGQSYEMQPQGQQQPLAQGAFLAAVNELRASISQTLTQDIQMLRQLQIQSSQSSSPRQYTEQIDEVRARCRGTNDDIRGRIGELFADAGATPAGGLRSTKERQLNALKQEWRAATQQMLQTEQDAEKMARNRWGEDGGEFTQALAQSSARTASSQNALLTLQERKSELQQIEQAIEELAQMFTYMDQLVVQQNDTIHQIEQQADQTVDHLVEANKHQTEAIKSARSWRKYKWWCLLVVVLILIAIAVGVAVGVTQARKTTGN